MSYQRSSERRTAFGGLTRPELMSRVRSSGNVTTELRMACLLRATGLKGWRRRHALVGKPDFVWPQHRLALFVDGCFWHGHGCGRNLCPRRNALFWEEKVRRNKQRDRSVTRLLRGRGWKVLRIWECVLARKPETCVQRIARALNHHMLTQPLPLR